MSEERLLTEAREIADLLISSSEHARNLFAQISGELGVPVAVARALCAMEGTAPMSELAGKLHCDKSYVTALADQLESLELVHRVPGPDRRVKMLELTSKGQSLRQRLE
ncbi:MAG: MarR family winged helix-turn-helix transcriptional regulator, partial [Micrococcales bacterium]